MPISLALSIFVSELILLFIIITFLILNFYCKISREIYKTNFLKYFIFFWVVLIISTLLSESISSSIRTSFFYFRFGFLVLIIKYLLENEEKFMKYFFYSLSATLLILAIYTFLQMAILKNAVDPNRISGVFGEELIQGSYFVRILPIFYALIYMMDVIKEKNRIFFLSVIVGISIILFSGERSSIASLAIFLFLTLIFLPVTFKQKIFSTAVVTFFIIFLLTLFDGTRNRIINSTINQVFDDNKIMIFSYGHQSHFLSAVTMIKKNFLTGIGPRNFRIECTKKDYEYIGRYKCSTHPHNTYLEIFAETGILGFLTILGFLLYIIKNLINLLLKKNKTKYTSFFFYNMAIFINIFPFLPTGSFFNNWISIIYYLPLGFFLYEKKKLSIK